MKTSGVILAGGKSTRMKFNKAFARLEGRPVVEIILNKCKNFFDETIIISNEPALYASLGFAIHPDVYPGMGPVAGIHSALFHARNEVVFIMGCDMPFMNMELVQFLLDCLEDYDCVVPVLDQSLQPLSAVYSRKCLPVLTECLEHDKLKLVRLIHEELRTRVVPENQMQAFGNPREIFMNVNDQTALLIARQIAGRYL